MSGTGRRRWLGGTRCAFLLHLISCPGRRTADAARLFSAYACNTALSVPSLVSGTTQCGVNVELNSPYSGAPGAVKVGFSLNEPLPTMSVVKVFLPDLTGPFELNSGGTSGVVGLVTAGGDEKIVWADVSFRSVAGGLEATVSMGESRQPTVKDGEAGFQFNLTYIRNPYGGQVNASARVSLLLINGSAWYEELVPLPRHLISGPLTADRVSFQLVTAGAAIESDVQVRLKTWGVIPATGRLYIYMPYGFILSAGSTVAQHQLNLPSKNALYVASLDEAGNNITIFMSGSMGHPLSSLHPHPPTSDLAFSFVLTRIRTPYSGLSGTFRVQSVTYDGEIIDEGNNIAGVYVPKGKLRDVSVMSSDNAARKECEITLTFGSTGRVPGNGKIVHNSQKNSI
jgi:hypothetical protein